MKGFFSEVGRFDVYAEFSNLRVFVPSADYLLAMTCLAMRLGEGSGAAVAVSVLRAALACHAGMATFAEAGVANKPH